MNTPINDGGPAFPIATEHVQQIADRTGETVAQVSHKLGTYPGMALRDYFAAAALQGFVVNNSTDTPDAVLCEWAYSAADAMLLARLNQPEALRAGE
jgi:hypothetical protein